jgi:Plasmid pRiA4b ORF-3-like protein
MAVYRFRICLEENDDIIRDIDIKAIQTFEQFHLSIQEAFKFDNKHAASFFVSDDYWRKNQEITYRKEDLPLDEFEIRKKVEPKKLMADTKIAKFIEQPHQRFVYIFDQNVQWGFLIEMVKIVEEAKKTTYPAIVKSIGTAPKQYKQVNMAKEELSADLAMAGLLNDPEIADDDIYKTIDTGEEAVEEEDLNSLEGEEGEDEEHDEELNEDTEDSENYGAYGADEDH